MHDLTERWWAALATLFAGWKLLDIVKTLSAGGSKLLDATNGRRQIAVNEEKVRTDAEAARARIAADEVIAHEKLMADAAASQNARLDTKTWEFVGRLETRLERVELRLATEEEARKQASVFADVATERADELQAKLREAEADRSILRLEIIQLNRQASERDATDRQKTEERDRQLADLYDLLRVANEKIALLERALADANTHANTHANTQTSDSQSVNSHEEGNLP